MSHSSEIGKLVVARLRPASANVDGAPGPRAPNSRRPDCDEAARRQQAARLPMRVLLKHFPISGVRGHAQA